MYTLQRLALTSPNISCPKNRLHYCTLSLLHRLRQRGNLLVGSGPWITRLSSPASQAARSAAYLQERGGVGDTQTGLHSQHKPCWRNFVQGSTTGRSPAMTAEGRSKHCSALCCCTLLEGACAFGTYLHREKGSWEKG